MTRYWIFLPILSYLLCSIPVGRLISRRVAGIDITTRGSGNIGATNVAREMGLKWGMLTLFLDILKGFVPVSIARLLLPGCEIALATVGLSALLGHQFSLYMRFRGGKGVATALGIYLAISPLAALIALIIFLLTVYLLDFISVGSMISTISLPILLIFSGQSKLLVAASMIMAALIFFKHRDNIQRLMRGEERKWKEKGAHARRSKRRSSSSSE